MAVAQLTQPKVKSKHPPESSTTIKLKNCSFHFDKLQVIDKVSLDVKENEFLSILGPSGCGKSTLLRLMLGLLSPDHGGTVLLQDRSVKMGMVFQKPLLMPWLTALENVELPLTIGPNKITSKHTRRLKAENALKLVELKDFANHYPQQLSGGMQHRVSIARALAAEPSVLLMDEPFGALDELTRETLNLELLRLWENPETSLKTIVMVTHSIQEAIFLSDRIALMSARPTSVMEIIDVPLPRPRHLKMEESPAYFETLSEIRRKVKTK